MEQNGDTVTAWIGMGTRPAWNEVETQGQRGMEWVYVCEAGTKSMERHRKTQRHDHFKHQRKR